MSVNLNLAVKLQGVNPPPVTKYSGWRGLHYNEGGYYNPLGMPVVLPSIDQHAVRMTETIQWISYKLMYKMNPENITPSKWTRLHDDDRVHTNGKGFQRGDSGAVKNFITGDGMDGEFPYYDKAFRLGGGQFTTGKVVGDRLVLEPGVDGLDANSVPETFGSKEQMDSYVDTMVQRLIDKSWFVYGISRHENFIEHFTQGGGKPVVYPFIFAKTIEFELKYFEVWDDIILPDPLKFYN